MYEIYGYDKETGADIIKVSYSWGFEYQKTNNMLHRDDGPAVDRNDGTKIWYKNGKIHRENGPALEYSNGDKRWYKHGIMHRQDGPAMINADGSEEWYYHGKEISKEEFIKNISLDFDRDNNGLPEKILTIRNKFNQPEHVNIENNLELHNHADETTNKLMIGGKQVFFNSSNTHKKIQFGKPK